MASYEFFNKLLTIAATVVLFVWPAYLSLFFRKPAQSQTERSHDSLSLAGICLQFGSVVLVWTWRRPLFSPLMENPVTNAVLMVLASAGVLAAFLISRTALSVLGRNWSFVAAVGRDHELVEHGPYASIRHPLYASFFLMTMATAVIWSRPAAIAVSGIIFAVGVWIRIRVEEKLLHEAFGLKFESYCRRVPGVLPIRRGKRV